MLIYQTIMRGERIVSWEGNSIAEATISKCIFDGVVTALLKIILRSTFLTLHLKISACK